jgi:predicted dithiol-disulfide oxidoreductase (DUF899 family)
MCSRLRSGPCTRRQPARPLAPRVWIRLLPFGDNLRRTLAPDRQEIARQFGLCRALLSTSYRGFRRPATGHNHEMEKPKVVSAVEWQQTRDELLTAEKEATHALDLIAAQRRRLPMVKFSNHYVFDTPTGKKTLLDLFEGREQLVVYQFMDLGPDDYCPGCTWFTNGVPATGLAGLADRGVTWVTVSNMPLVQIDAYKARMGWTLPFVSSRGTSFADDCGAGPGFMLSVFLRDGDDVYRTYSTTARGVDRLVFANSILDLTPYGRQEDWEDSPPGWPQHPTYG